MRNVNFLKISFKCGFLSSNLLNFNAMENIINLKSNIETNNIYNKKEKEEKKIENFEQFKNEYLDEYDSETKQLQFFNIKEIPEDIMDYDLIEAYLKYI